MTSHVSVTVVLADPHEPSPEGPPPLASGGATRPDPLPSILSRREGEILELLSHGLTGESIARRLILSSETVKTHIRNAMVKLEASTRVHAIAIAIRSGYISGLEPASAGAAAAAPATDASEHQPVVG